MTILAGAKFDPSSSAAARGYTGHQDSLLLAAGPPTPTAPTTGHSFPTSQAWAALQAVFRGIAMVSAEISTTAPSDLTGDWRGARQFHPDHIPVHVIHIGARR